MSDFIRKFCSDSQDAKTELAERECSYLFSAARHVNNKSFAEFSEMRNKGKEREGWHKENEEFSVETERELALKEVAAENRIGCDCKEKFDILWCDDTCGCIEQKVNDYVEETQMAKNEETYIEKTLRAMHEAETASGEAKRSAYYERNKTFIEDGLMNPEPEEMFDIRRPRKEKEQRTYIEKTLDAMNELDGTPENADEVQRADQIEMYVSGNHYNDVVPGMQYMEMMQYMLADKAGVEAHLFGQIYKYMMRAGKKDDYEQDLRKARWYMNCLVKYVQTGQIDPNNNDG